MRAGKARASVQTEPIAVPNEWCALRWTENGVILLDQRRLPAEEAYLTLRSAEEVAQAIESLAVRGAPAIGCAAAFGLAREAVASGAADPATLGTELRRALERLARTRPTAVNLFWALGRMRETLDAGLRDPAADVAALRERVVAEAQRIFEENVATCREIGQAGLPLVPEGARILTHCNTGALATGGYGTALGVVRAAFEAGRDVSVLADETRPFLQGARLTAWELKREGIPVTVIADAMAGHLMRRGEVDLVAVGADRIAANGDVANKIGTYTLAVLAREHAIPFYVAVPIATIDLATPTGDAIPLEERGREEVAFIGDAQLVPEEVPVRHPAFDVTPAALVTAIVTERGIARPPYLESLAALVAERA